MEAATVAEMSQPADEESKDQPSTGEVVMEIFTSFQQAFNNEQDIREVSTNFL